MKNSIDIFEVFGCAFVNRGKVKEGRHNASTRSGEDVSRNIEFTRDRQSTGGEEVCDKSRDGVICGNGNEGMVKIRVIEVKDFKDEGFTVGGGGDSRWREGNGGKVVEDNGRKRS